MPIFRINSTVVYEHDRFDVISFWFYISSTRSEFSGMRWYFNPFPSVYFGFTRVRLDCWTRNSAWRWQWSFKVASLQTAVLLPRTHECNMIIYNSDYMPVTRRIMTVRPERFGAEFFLNLLIYDFFFHRANLYPTKPTSIWIISYNYLLYFKINFIFLFFSLYTVRF